MLVIQQCLGARGVVRLDVGLQQPGQHVVPDDAVIDLRTGLPGAQEAMQRIRLGKVAVARGRQQVDKRVVHQFEQHREL